MVRATIISSLTLAALCACSGGSSGGGSSMVTGPTVPVTPATTAPTNQAPLATATLGGGAGFVNAAHHTVYVFDLDLSSPGQSACNGTCAQSWPPVGPPAGAALPSSWSTIMRSDGSMQLTYAGRPLYTFVADAQPGDTHGDGLVAFGGLWHIARPQAAAATPAPTSTPVPPPMGY